MIASGICEEEWQEIVLERIGRDLELNVRNIITILEIATRSFSIPGRIIIR